MFQRVLIALGISVSLFVIYLVFKFYSTSYFEVDNFISNAPLIEQQAPVEPLRIISPAGPNPPSARAPTGEEVAPPVVTPLDPLEDANGSQNMKDTLRHPERMFSPGVQPRDTTSSVMSGVASNETQVTSQALQTFVPEMAQNGGEFMQGIAANDTLGDTEYAAF
jgi:hypothetical protein